MALRHGGSLRASVLVNAAPRRRIVHFGTHSGRGGGCPHRASARRARAGASQRSRLRARRRTDTWRRAVAAIMACGGGGRQASASASAASSMVLGGWALGRLGVWRAILAVALAQGGWLPGQRLNINTICPPPLSRASHRTTPRCTPAVHIDSILPLSSTPSSSPPCLPRRPPRRTTTTCAASRAPRRPPRPSRPSASRSGPLASDTAMAP